MRIVQCVHFTYLVQVFDQIEASFEYELSSFDRIFGQTRDVTEITLVTNAMYSRCTKIRTVSGGILDFC